jgi:hypothetical protein
MREHPTPIDNDDISQHELMMTLSSDDTEESDLLEMKKPTRGGYGQIVQEHKLPILCLFLYVGTAG